MTLSRRAFLAGSTALTLAAPAAATSPAMPFSAQTVIDRARELSLKSYSERPMVPKDWLLLKPKNPILFFWI